MGLTVMAGTIVMAGSWSQLSIWSLTLMVITPDTAGVLPSLRLNGMVTVPVKPSAGVKVNEPSGLVVKVPEPLGDTVLKANVRLSPSASLV